MIVTVWSVAIFKTTLVHQDHSLLSLCNWMGSIMQNWFVMIQKITVTNWQTSHHHLLSSTYKGVAARWWFNCKMIAGTLLSYRNLTRIQPLGNKLNRVGCCKEMRCTRLRRHTQMDCNMLAVCLCLLIRWQLFANVC